MQIKIKLGVELTSPATSLLHLPARKSDACISGFFSDHDNTIKFQQFAHIKSDFRCILSHFERYGYRNQLYFLLIFRNEIGERMVAL